MAEETRDPQEIKQAQAIELTKQLFDPKNDYVTNKADLNYYDESSISADNLTGIVTRPITDTNGTDTNRLKFDLPQWGVEDYINDRTKWIKGIRSIADEPGWFYFKVFFKFNTNFGLFGATMNPEGVMQSTCALRYLNSIKTLYKAEQIPMRINALLKFAGILSQINANYPWMIKGIAGLEKIMSPQINNFSEDKSFELIFNTETTDMKLINLLNYYKYACYDDINCKEIIPENLRKFDMMVVFYHVPIKYFQTAIMVSPKRDITTGIIKPGTKLAKAEEIINKTFNFLTTKSTYFKYKRMTPPSGVNEDYSNLMSFNMYTFHNCEFDIESFNKYFEGGEMKNETAFQFNETSIKIKYEKVYFHTMNEWSQTLFGTDGFYYDKNFGKGSGLNQNDVDKLKGIGISSDNFKLRLNSLAEAHDGSTFFDKNAEQYKSIIDFAESIVTDGLMNMSMKNYYAFLKGNIYGDLGPGSKYFDAKMSVLSEGHNGTVSGNLFGVDKELSKFRRGEESYFARKLRAIKDGTIKYSSSEGLYGNDIYDYSPDAEWSFKQLRQDLINERMNFTPSLVIDQQKKQQTNILNYITGNLGDSKLSGKNDGLLGGIKKKINNAASFFKMSKNDW